eukprot:2632122-Amphidinium_carterae.1
MSISMPRHYMITGRRGSNIANDAVPYKYARILEATIHDALSSSVLFLHLKICNGSGNLRIGSKDREWKSSEMQKNSTIPFEQCLSPNTLNV